MAGHKLHLRGALLVWGYTDILNCVSGGSGSAYIYGWCDDNWRPGMTEAECKAFVVQAVSHAMARDGSSGGNIRTVIVSQEGVKRDFLEGAKVWRLLPEEPCQPMHGHLQPELH